MLLQPNKYDALYQTNTIVLLPRLLFDILFLVLHSYSSISFTWFLFSTAHPFDNELETSCTILICKWWFKRIIIAYASLFCNALNRTYFPPNRLNQILLKILTDHILSLYLQQELPSLNNITKAAPETPADLLPNSKTDSYSRSFA